MLLSKKQLLPAALAGAVALTGTLATTRPASAEYVVPGAPGVANVSVVQGDVVIVRGDGGGQWAATINTPVLPGDYLSTAGDSRSEVQFSGVSMLRLARDTQVRFISLDPRSREMQLAIGTAELSELRGSGGGPQLDTPSVTVRPNRTGDYRVSVLPNGVTLVTVRGGAATVSTARGSRVLQPGSTLRASGPYANPAISFEPAAAYDAFDTFNQRRDDAILASYDANRSLAPALAGYTNFANYGRWYDLPSYGEVWSPTNQSNGWSPYGNGQWVWEPGYGYTWVGNEPWGYAPYHYGNWFYSTAYNQWMWQPPAYQYQSNADVFAASWLPALVGFFLTGGTNGYGGIGWVPLAPGEQYVPWYSGFGSQASYPPYAVRSVTNVYEVYRNIRYVKIVRIYQYDRFRDGDWHRPILMHPDQLARVGVVRGSLPIVPTRALLRGSTVATAHPIVLSNRFREQRFATHAPTVTTTFAKAQRNIEAVVENPVALETARPARTAAPIRPVHTPAPLRPLHTAAPLRPVHTGVPMRVRPPTPAPHRHAPPHETPAPPRAATPHATLAPHHAATPHASATKKPGPETTPKAG